jgi:hypothetical protein
LHPTASRTPVPLATRASSKHVSQVLMSDKQHVFTLDASGRHVLMVDPGNVNLIRDASWFVEPM